VLAGVHQLAEQQRAAAAARDDAEGHAD
jgi:hypothetical protein